MSAPNLPPKPINPHVCSVTYMQEGLADDIEMLTVRIETEGAGHYVQLSSERWSLDIDELDDLAGELRSLVRRANVAWGEPSI